MWSDCVTDELTSGTKCFSCFIYATKTSCRGVLMLLKTCLVVSKNKVPARIQRCIGSTGMKEIAVERNKI